MGTLAVTVTAGGSPRQYVLVKAYGNMGWAATGITNGSGVVNLTVPDGWYKLSVEDTATNEWAPQFVGETGSGVPTFEQSGEFVVTGGGTTAVTVLLADDIQLYGEAVQGINYTWWKDTTNSTIIRLFPGEWRRPFSGDTMDPLYKHVLVGPFPTRAEAVSA